MNTTFTHCYQPLLSLENHVKPSERRNRKYGGEINDLHSFVKKKKLIIPFQTGAVRSFVPFMSNSPPESSFCPESGLAELLERFPDRLEDRHTISNQKIH